ADRDAMAGLLRRDVDASAAEERAWGMDVGRSPNVVNRHEMGTRTDADTTPPRAVVTVDSGGRTRGSETGGRGSGDDSPTETAQRS
ncbi:hypothetical protein ABZY57_32820, partial [Streptomyces sp. NPDC006450]|uniref:hypothetical protein n=1 Tax=Streptomyces sp. NPDC006450 TaxID=3155458 RepID=UPI0033B5D5EF